MQRILGLLNQSNSLEHIVRLSNIETEDDLNRCIADQYAVAFTKAQWVERFPKIPPENVVCAQGTLNVNGLMYYDPKHGICFPLHLFGNSLLFDKTDDDFQRRTCSMISELEQCHADRDYRRLLQPVVSEGTGKIVMQLLLDLLNADEPNSKLYTTIIHEYSFCDGGAGVLANSPDFAEKMMRCKSRQQKASTRKKLKGFPDVIPVYRGEGSESTPYTKAFSWTTEINTAYFFASRLGGERSRVVNGFVKKEDVLEYLADRNESEIIVVADGLFCREIDGLFCRSSPDIIVRRRCVLSHKRRGWLQPSPSFRYSRNLALQDELYHPVINNGPAVLVCVDKRLGTGPVNQSRDAG